MITMTSKDEVIVERCPFSQVAPKIWANYFERTKREHKDSYTFPEFFGIYLAVESGEFLSLGDPDPYKEPGARTLEMENSSPIRVMCWISLMILCR